MKIDIPDKKVWHNYADAIEAKINSGADEPEMLKYFRDNSWILLMMFASDCEGVCFTEYLLGEGECPDFLVVHGRSYPDISIIEFKHPSKEFFTSRGTMTKELNEAMTATLNRMFMVNVSFDHYYNRLTKEVEELWKGIRRPYQGVFSGPLNSNFEIPFQKSGKYWAKIIIGRDSGTTRDKNFREGVSQFLGRVELLTYDSILRQLRKHLPDDPS